MLVAVPHHVTDEEGPAGIMATLMAAMAPGSYLVISHPAADMQTEAVAQVQAQHNERVATGQTRRPRDQIEGFFGGLDLLPPGVVQTPQCRPEKAASGSVPMWAVSPASPGEA